MDIYWGLYQTKFGPCIIGVYNGHVCWLSFEQGLDNLHAGFPGSRLIQRQDLVLCQRIFNNQPVPIYLEGTEFQKLVWTGCYHIPRGKIITYGDLASFIGRPNSYRAVGTALGANKIAYIIPCHRVVPSSRMIGNYRWGQQVKRAILEDDSQTS